MDQPGGGCHPRPRSETVSRQRFSTNAPPAARGLPPDPSPVSDRGLRIDRSGRFLLVHRLRRWVWIRGGTCVDPTAAKCDATTPGAARRSRAFHSGIASRQRVPRGSYSRHGTNSFPGRSLRRTRTGLRLKPPEPPEQNDLANNQVGCVFLLIPCRLRVMLRSLIRSGRLRSPCQPPWHVRCTHGPNGPPNRATSYSR